MSVSVVQHITVASPVALAGALAEEVEKESPALLGVCLAIKESACDGAVGHAPFLTGHVVDVLLNAVGCLQAQHQHLHAACQESFTAQVLNTMKSTSALSAYE